MQHSKFYQNFSEDSRRMNIYLQNRDTINQHNMRYQRGQTTYRMALNKYSDLTHEEYITQMTGLMPSLR